MNGEDLPSVSTVTKTIDKKIPLCIFILAVFTSHFFFFFFPQMSPSFKVLLVIPGNLKIESVELKESLSYFPKITQINFMLPLYLVLGFPCCCVNTVWVSAMKKYL